MFEGEGEALASHQSAKAESQKPEPQSVTVEGQQANTALTVGEKPLEKDPQDKAQLAKPEQPAKPPEKVLSAAEKQKLKEKAVTALNQLTKEAARISGINDFFLLLDLTAGSADIKDGERIKAAYREKVAYFHPDKANRKVHEILGDVGRLFPELTDQAHTARLACEEATKKLNQAADFLKDKGRREKYLAEHYGIHAGLPETAKAQGERPQQRQEKPRQTAPDWVKDAQAGNEQSFQDWREKYQSDAWKQFTQEWNDKYQPFVERPRKFTSLVELIREGRGERYLSELRSIAQEALQEVKNMESLKKLLKLILGIYEVLKSKYSLKTEKRGLPVEITMASIQGVLGQLNRPEDGNQRWMTKMAAETRLSLLKNSINVILNYLKPEPLGPNPFRTRKFASQAAATR